MKLSKELKRRLGVKPNAIHSARIKGGMSKSKALAIRFRDLFAGDPNVLYLEYKFHPTRKWAFDIGWPYLRVALEIEGGTWINGGHSRGSGSAKDREKFNEAAAMGWRVLHVTPKELLRPDTFELVRRCLNG